MTYSCHPIIFVYTLFLVFICPLFINFCSQNWYVFLINVRLIWITHVFSERMSKKIVNKLKGLKCEMRLNWKDAIINDTDKWVPVKSSGHILKHSRKNAVFYALTMMIQTRNFSISLYSYIINSSLMWWRFISLPFNKNYFTILQHIADGTFK